MYIYYLLVWFPLSLCFSFVFSPSLLHILSKNMSHQFLSAVSLWIEHQHFVSVNKRHLSVYFNVFQVVVVVDETVLYFNHSVWFNNFILLFCSVKLKVWGNVVAWCFLQLFVSERFWSHSMESYSQSFKMNRNEQKTHISKIQEHDRTSRTTWNRFLYVLLFTLISVCAF